MNDIIYGIFDGEYSDWQCIGYFENEEDAYRYCAETTREYRNPYVLEIGRIDCDFGNETVFYEYTCCFSPDGEISWTTLNESSLRAKPPIFDTNPHRTLVTFMTLKLDKNLAEKTAYDLFAKWKNEKELRDKE